jgi:hypothetical protein
MGPRCFIKNETNPPVCGIHNVPLVKGNIPIDENAPHLGRIPCYQCPVTEEVLPDPESSK